MAEKTERIVSPDELTAEAIEITKVHVDDNGGVMFVGSITADEFVEWSAERDSGEPDARKNASARLIVRSLVKGQNDPTRIGTPDMVPKFRAARVARTERLLKAIFKLNGIGVLAESAAKNV